MSSKRSVRAKRDTFDIASPLLGPGQDWLTGPFASLASFSRPEISQDRRVWSPGRPPLPVLRQSGRPARQVAAPFGSPLSGVAFKSPKGIPLCVRRQRRKEVLHALRRVGKGTGGGRHRITPDSLMRCK